MIELQRELFDPQNEDDKQTSGTLKFRHHHDYDGDKLLAPARLQLRVQA